MKTRAREVGDRGEALARQHLERSGYAILARNWTCLYGEIDIIAERESEIVFVEVKTRHGAIDDALDGIAPVKAERVIKAAWTYLHESGLDEARWRIDVIAVALHRHRPPQICHIEDALDW